MDNNTLISTFLLVLCSHHAIAQTSKETRPLRNELGFRNKFVLLFKECSQIASIDGLEFPKPSLDETTDNDILNKTYICENPAVSTGHYYKLQSTFIPKSGMVDGQYKKLKYYSVDDHKELLYSVKAPEIIHESRKVKLSKSK